MYTNDYQAPPDPSRSPLYAYRCSLNRPPRFSLAPHRRYGPPSSRRAATGRILLACFYYGGLALALVLRAAIKATFIVLLFVLIAVTSALPR